MGEQRARDRCFEVQIAAVPHRDLDQRDRGSILPVEKWRQDGAAELPPDGGFGKIKALQTGPAELPPPRAARPGAAGPAVPAGLAGRQGAPRAT